MIYTYQKASAGPNGVISLNNAVAEGLDELPDGKWVLSGGVRPTFLTNDEKHGEIWRTLPRFDTKQIRVIVQILQPRFEDNDEVVTWYLENIVTRMVDVFNNSQGPKILRSV